MRRRNPTLEALSSRRQYFVRDNYLGGFQDFPSLKQAARYALRSSDCGSDDIGRCIFIEQDETYVPLNQASPAAVKMVSHYLNRNPMRSRRSRRNPAHVSYGRWLFTLNFPASDPIIELAAAWARGEDAPTKLVRLAYLSAERWTEAKDKHLRQAGKSVMNKLKGWLEAGERDEFKHAPNTLASARRYLNPGRGRNPNKGNKARHIKLAMMEVTNGWDYDMVSAEDSITGYEEEHHVSFTAEEKAYIMANAKPGSHMESQNPRRRKHQQPKIARGHVTYSGYGVHHDKRRRALDRIGKAETRDRNPLPYEHAARLLSPSQVIESSYRRKNVKGGSIGLLFAKLKGGRPGKRGGVMKLASVRFRAAHFTPGQARTWMTEHGLHPILFEAATEGRRASWKQESVRARRSGRKGRSRRRAA